MDVLPDPDLVSLHDAAVILKMSERTMYRLVKTGELPGAVKVGGIWRVSLVRYRRSIHGQETQ